MPAALHAASRIYPEHLYYSTVVRIIDNSLIQKSNASRVNSRLLLLPLPL